MRKIGVAPTEALCPGSTLPSPPCNTKHCALVTPPPPRPFRAAPSRSLGGGRGAPGDRGVPLSVEFRTLPVEGAMGSAVAAGPRISDCAGMGATPQVGSGTHG